MKHTTFQALENGATFVAGPLKGSRLDMEGHTDLYRKRDGRSAECADGCYVFVPDAGLRVYPL